jgi:NAD-dependent dihydropyrimidine dehydrogenase PreA subunit
MNKKIKVIIDTARCNGCGQCVIACHEGVIKLVDGKARVINESSCDGLGACIGECPQGAITLAQEDPARMPCGCPGASTIDLRADKNKRVVTSEVRGAESSVSLLQNWPVQLHLINPEAPFLKNADLLVAADCVGFAHPDFHDTLLKNKILINFCPKLDRGLDEYADKLVKIFKDCNIKSVTIAHMEVPCCSGLVKITQEALRVSGKRIPLLEITVSIRGAIL